MATSVCRVCLIGNTRMLNIDNIHLLEMYEKLTDTKLHIDRENGMPSTVCYVCHRQLQKCQRFSHVAHKSNKILQDLLLNGTEITQNMVTMQSQGMYNLSVTPIKYIYMHSNNENNTDTINEEIGEKETIDTIEEVVIKTEVISDSEEMEEIKLEMVEETLDSGIIKTELSLNNDMYNKITPKMTTTPSQGMANSPVTGTEYISIDIDSDTLCTIESIKVEPDVVIEEEDTEEEMKFETYDKEFESDLSNNTEACENKDGSVKHKSNLHSSKKNKKKSPSHLKLHAKEKPYSCNICDRAFTHKHTLKHHMIVHSGERLHSCDRCDKAFTQKSNLVTHMLVHTGEKPYPCSGCDKAFTQKSTLMTHMLIHTGERPYSCNICDKAFAQKSNLQKHMLVHSGEKPFSCKRCDKVFGCKSNLTKHFLVHSGEKPYSCNVCLKSFTQKSTLTLHMLVHTGEKPFCCMICDKAYTCRSNLTKHMLVHSGIRPHSCSICGKSFTQKSTLTTHMLLHSGETSCSSEQQT